jgi:hypothetical protein
LLVEEHTAEGLRLNQPRLRRETLIEAVRRERWRNRASCRLTRCRLLQHDYPAACLPALVGRVTGFDPNARRYGIQRRG